MATALSAPWTSNWAWLAPWPMLLLRLTDSLFVLLLAHPVRNPKLRTPLPVYTAPLTAASVTGPCYNSSTPGLCYPVIDKQLAVHLKALQHAESVSQRVCAGQRNGPLLIL